MTRYFAHSTQQPEKGDWQPLRDHLMAVAELAAVCRAKFRADKAAGLAGLLHDLGKYTEGFQRRLSGSESVDHASAGAQQVRDLARSGQDRLMAELVAYAIAGHHTGLPDRDGGEDCLSDRLNKKLNSVIRPGAPRLSQTHLDCCHDSTGQKPSQRLPSSSAFSDG